MRLPFSRRQRLYMRSVIPADIDWTSNVMTRLGIRHDKASFSMASDTVRRVLDGDDVLANVDTPTLRLIEAVMVEDDVWLRDVIRDLSEISPITVGGMVTAFKINGYEKATSEFIRMIQEELKKR